MIFEISHYSNYQFDSPVFLEPQTLRFKPKTNHLQKLVSFNLDIQPQPVNLSEQIDLEGTQSHFCWFEGLHSQLIVSSHCKMEVPHFNPYDFVVYPDEFTQLGFKYPENIYSIISPNLEPISSTPQLKIFTQEIKFTIEPTGVSWNYLLSFFTCTFVVNLDLALPRMLPVMGTE